METFEMSLDLVILNLSWSRARSSTRHRYPKALPFLMGTHVSAQIPTKDSGLHGSHTNIKIRISSVFLRAHPSPSCKSIILGLNEVFSMCLQANEESREKVLDDSRIALVCLKLVSRITTIQPAQKGILKEYAEDHLSQRNALHKDSSRCRHPWS